MKKSFLIIFNFILACSLFAQQDSYQWRLGLHSGIMSYYGDLSNSYFDAQHPFVNPTDNLDYLSYAVSIENNFSKTFSWKLQASQGQFQAYDRSIDFDGNLIANDNRNRAINVQTDITNLAFTVNFYTDNDWLLNQKAWIAPYFSVGAGITRFTPYGDLFLENGNRYYYWNDGTIRDADESNTNANIIEQDLIFETNLANVQTEQVNYRTSTLSFPLGVGLKFRISDRINLNAEIQGQYTLTDYLDDVSGSYPTNYDNPLQAYASLPGTTSSTNRGTNSDLNDIFGMASISLHYSFGYKMESFLPPTLYTIGATETAKPPISNNKTEKETTSETSTQTTNTVSNDENIKSSQDTNVIIIVKNETRQDTTIIVNNEQNTNDKIQVKIDTIISISETNDTTLETKVTVINKEQKSVKKITNEEIKIQEKELSSKGVSIVDLDGNPVEDKRDTDELVATPTSTKDDNAGLVIIPDDDISIKDNPINPIITDTLKTATDVSIFEEIKSKVDSVASKPLEVSTPKIDLSDLDLEPDTKIEQPNIEISTNEQDKELLLNIEETRSDVLKLTNEFNKLIIAQQADKEEIRIVNAKLDSLTTMLMNAQQFNNNVAIRANEDYSDANKIAIRNATSELEKELEAIKSQLERANSDYEKAIVYANQQQKDSERKNAELDRKVKLLKAELKLEKQKRKQAERQSKTTIVHNPSRLKNDTDSFDAAMTSSIDTITQVDTIKIEQETDNLLNVLDSLVADIEAEKAKELATKESEVSDLKRKLLEMEQKLEASQKEKATIVVPNNDKENEAIKALEGKIDQLTTKISDLEKAEPKVVTVEKPVEAKPIVAEKPTEIPRSEQIANAIKGYQVSNVYFQSGKSSVDKEFYQRLERISNLMLVYPELRAIVTGYADKSGNPEINFKLSRQRSEAVKTFLLQQGIRQDRIEVNYLGETKATKANDPYSRRVEIQLIY